LVPLIDVHCHLTAEALAHDLEAVLHRAAEAGVSRMICMGETPEDNRRVLALARTHPAVRAALGHYPEHLDDTLVEETEALIRAHRSEIVALGEVGLDHRLAEAPEARERQQVVLRRLVRLAQELDLPLSVHSRSAGHHAIALLRDLGARRVCLHAFDGKARYAREAAELGWYLSVPPSVVRSEQQRKLVAAVPLCRLLLETDSPVLGPDPGARNEPANLRLSAAAIAEIQGVPLEQVLEVCHASTLALFGDALR
jgi:TatD DNase family protein